MKKKKVDEASPDIKKVLRRAGDMDIQQWKENKSREPQALIRARAITRQLNIQMKLCEVEIQADGRKATFFYTADDRVDFRELIKIFASEFKVKVEMKQIGARQESAKVGGIGSCGVLCCSMAVRLKALPLPLPDTRTISTRPNSADNAAAEILPELRADTIRCIAEFSRQCGYS
jgi:cell fate regulator YaaT (PSP1 superfamily)